MNNEKVKILLASLKKADMETKISDGKIMVKSMMKAKIPSKNSATLEAVVNKHRPIIKHKVADLIKVLEDYSREFGTIEDDIRTPQDFIQDEILIRNIRIKIEIDPELQN